MAAKSTAPKSTPIGHQTEKEYQQEMAEEEMSSSSGSRESELEVPRAGDTAEANEHVGPHFCEGCDLPVEDKEDGILCEGVCARWFHPKCVKLSESEYERLAGSKDQWLCETCNIFLEPTQRSSSQSTPGKVNNGNNDPLLMDATTPTQTE